MKIHWAGLAGTDKVSAPWPVAITPAACAPHGSSCSRSLGGLVLRQPIGAGLDEPCGEPQNRPRHEERRHARVLVRKSASRGERVARRV